MNPILASSSLEIFITAFGVAAAILALGGIILLRFQRSRQEFVLMKTALERGITAFPQGQPFWLISFRQGLLTLTLGIGLLACGVAGFGLARRVPMPDPEPAAALALPATQPAEPAAPASREKNEKAEKRPKPEPRPHNPAKERWDRAQRQETASLGLGGAGLILILLGIVRMAFARVEKAQAARLVE